MEAILWESGARGIDELEELRMEQEEAVTMRRGGSVAGSSPTPGLEETIVEQFRAWRKDPTYDPVYQIGIDVPGWKNPREGQYIDKIPEETLEEYKFRRELEMKKK